VATKIQWTEETWNPCPGCFKVSPGCKNCYAIRQVIRLKGNPNEKIAQRYFNIVDARLSNWTGETSIDSDVLMQPLKRRKPTMYFISLSDLFFTNRPDYDINRVLAVIALTPHHTYQILTKYAARMQDHMAHLARSVEPLERAARDLGYTFNHNGIPLLQWPIPNLWLGVSVENQQYADERIPLLLRTPAAKRFVSYEPALDAVDFTHLYGRITMNGSVDVCVDALRGKYTAAWHGRKSDPLLSPNADCQKLDWLIVGGESGPGARPFDITWARQTVEQCMAANVACFVKQLGARPYREGAHRQNDNGVGSHREKNFLALRDKKGGAIDEWPEDIRVRQMPGEASQ
jgi:protein gp37